MTRCGFQRGGDLQHLRFAQLSGVCGLSQVDLVERLYIFGQCAGFIKDVLIDFSQFFDGFRLNDEYVALGQRALRGGHHGGHRQCQSAWAGNDQYRHDDFNHTIGVVQAPVHCGQRTDDQQTVEEHARGFLRQ